MTSSPFSTTKESSAAKQQPKLLTSETLLRGSVNCRATNHGAGISAISSAPSTTDEPAEKHGQKSPEEYTYNIEPFEQTDDSFICSDVPVKQHLKLQVQTDSQLSEKKQPKTCDLARGKIRSKVTEKSLGEKRHEDYEKGRCPFCQMPFGALSGQSPNWHTMECMDVPLTTTQECPAGLLCDDTVPSHYRRYAHSLLALHLAGQHQDSNGLSASPGGPAGHSSTDQVTVSPPPTARDIRMGTKRAVPEENQGSGGKARSLKRKQSSSKPKSGQSESRSLKRKQSSSNPKNCQSSSGTSSSQSLSQSSQNSTGSNGSIKAYFSPTKKGEGCDNRPCEENKDGESDPESDHVLGSLVVSDSDSNQSTETQGEEEKQTETCVDKGNCDIQKSDQDPSSHLPQSKGGSVCDLGNSSMDDFGCGFLAEELDDEKSATGSADAEKTLTDKGVFSGVHLQALSDDDAESQQGCSTACSSTTRTSAAPPYAIQKQTSLFSYFKPQCHSATVPQQAGPKGGTPVAPKTSVTNKSLEKNRKSWQGDKKTDKITRTKSGLVKSPSEPGKVRPVPALCPDSISVPAPAPSSVGQTNGIQQRTGASQPAVAASSSFRKGSRRQCPFYKRLPGTSITVDAFSYGEIAGCGAYVLTHFHYDHYQGLTKRFAQPLFCSQVTGNLVERQIGVDRKWINRLPLNEPCHIAGVKATLMEANHCPGAVIILFELPNGKNLLHTGDFRAAPCMEEYPPLVGVGVDELYLDTTYCDPSHAFPSQKETIEFAVTTALKAVAQDPFTLVVCGAYTIGKERIFIAIAHALQTKVCVPAAKKRVLDCLEDARLKAMLTLQWTEGSVHVLPMRQLNAQGLGKHLQHCPQSSVQGLGKHLQYCPQFSVQGLGKHLQHCPQFSSVLSPLCRAWGSTFNTVLSSPLSSALLCPQLSSVLNPLCRAWGSTFNTVLSSPLSSALLCPQLSSVLSSPLSSALLCPQLSSVLSSPLSSALLCPQLSSVLSSPLSSVLLCPQLSSVLSSPLSSALLCPQLSSVLSSPLSSILFCPQFSSVLSPLLSSVLLCPQLSCPQSSVQGLGKHLRQCPQFSSVLAFEPTGWTHSKRTLALDNLRPKFSGRGITVYGVPYSEHSSFLEMKRFVQFLRPKKILPTVNNGNPTSRRKMEAIFRQWLAERTPPPQPGSASSATQPGSASSATQPSLGAWLARRS
ncbi:hypothetical protein ACOMHN_028764 [Nucella lapillus]